MKIRFLEVTASQVKEMPFLPGQIIEVTSVDNPPEVRRWLKSRHAEVVREEPELAIAPPPEIAAAPAADLPAEPPSTETPEPDADTPQRRGRRRGA